MTDDIMHRGGGESAGIANPGFNPLGASGLDASSVNNNSCGGDKMPTDSLQCPGSSAGRGSAAETGDASKIVS